MVIEDRRNNERPIENPGDEESVLEFRELVAEAAMRRVVEEPFR